MGIIKQSHQTFDKETLFFGRVSKVITTTEERNWSDTMDYSDYRTTSCTYAMIYLGHHGVPGDITREGRIMTHMYVQTGMYPNTYVPRDLKVHERFAWVDCTNLFSDRFGYSLKADEDAFGDVMLHCGAEIYDELTAFEAHHAAVRDARIAESARQEAIRKAAEEVEKAKKAARQAKRDAKEAELKASAEKLLARIPAKGTEVTVDGFTGKVFWTGVSKYYGTFTARAGVKDAKGEVVWVDAVRF